MNQKTTIKPKIGRIKGPCTRFFRVRNVHGEVTACVIYDPMTVRIGFAFCNPKDFNLPRKIRRAKGGGIAYARAKDAQLKSSGGSALAQAPVADSDEERFLAIKETVLRVLSKSGWKYFGTYHGDGESEFVSWYVPFRKKLVEDCPELPI